MNQWVYFDAKTGDFSAPGVDPETGRYPPSRRAVAVVTGTMVAVALGAALTLWDHDFSDFSYAFLAWLPFFVGAVVGALSRRRPLRNAMCTVVAGLALWALALGGYALYLIILWPLPLPGALLGAWCGHTLRRSMRARKYGAFLGWER